MLPLVLAISLFNIDKYNKQDQSGRVPLYWGITADGFVVFSGDAEMLKGACGKPLASFPRGCFFSTAIGELWSYENPNNKITAIPAADGEIQKVQRRRQRLQRLGRNTLIETREGLNFTFNLDNHVLSCNMICATFAIGLYTCL